MSVYAITVKPQHEKTAASALKNRGFEAYLPLHSVRRTWCDRIKTLDVPLFEGYVFCRFLLGERVAVLRAPGVRRIVGFHDGPVAIDAQQIATIRSLVSSGLPLTPWPFIEAGRRVMVKRGPLQGLEGVVLRIRDSCRVVVNANILHRAVAVEIDPGWLTVVSDDWKWQETA